jgi:subtilisin family serine protease
VVIEAGCNGGYDLDSYTNLSGKKIFDRSSPDFRDSGAIMVGAGSSAAPHTRLGFSNHGNRIDCYGWGEHVDTTTTNSAGTDNTAYTGSFNGTSSASPIVTGAAVVTQGLAQLETIARLPAGSRAFVEIPGWLADVLRPHACEIKVDGKSGRVTIPFNTAGRQRLGTAILHAKGMAACHLLIEIPEAERKRHAYEVAIRQVYKQVEVGRVTWRLGGPKKK